MSFHNDAIFPDTIAQGSLAGPGFRTEILEQPSGHEYRIQKWSQPRFQYDVSRGIASWANLSTIRHFFMARRGSAYGFKFKDPIDYSTGEDDTEAPTDTDELLAIAPGGVTDFQIIKKYEKEGVYEFTRTIEKPIDGTVVVSLNDVPQPSGWSVNTSTGIITFSVAPPSTTQVKAGCEFYVPVRFSKETGNWLNISVEAFNSGQLDSIMLLEIKGERDNPEDFDFGGAIYEERATSKTLTLGDARVQSIALTAAINVYLPDASIYPGGYPYWVIHNADDAFNITVKDWIGTTVGTITPGNKVVCMLVTNDSNERTWVLCAL